jgi:hypothetical protein
MAALKKYSIPKFPPNSAAKFRSLCKACDPSEIPKLRERLTEAVAHMLEETKRNELLNKNMVEVLADRSFQLLDRYESLTKKQRALAIGAIYYFAMEADGSSDGNFATGLDDDCAIMNYVLQQLEIDNLYIELI